MLWKLLSRKVISFGLLIIFIFGAGIYFLVLMVGIQDEKERILDQQETLLRAEVANLNTFFSNFGRAVAVRASQSNIREIDTDRIQNGMDAFVDQWSDSDYLGGIALTDSDGVVILNSNVLGTDDHGTSLSDRDYFLWASDSSNKGKYFVGHPVVGRGVATAGGYIVPVASGVYSGEIFLGVVVASAKLDPLLSDFLGILRVDDNSHVHLVDHEVIYFDHLKPDAVGSSFLKRHPGADEQTMKDAMGAEGESGFVMDIPNVQTHKAEEHLFNFAPITLGEHKLWLVMHTPYEGKTDLNIPLGAKIAVAVFFVFTSIALFTAVGKKIGFR